MMPSFSKGYQALQTLRTTALKAPVDPKLASKMSHTAPFIAYMKAHIKLKNKFRVQKFLQSKTRYIIAKESHDTQDIMSDTLYTDKRYWATPL